MYKAKVFLTNDRVFARVKGYPAWPACVIGPKGYALYKVFFYGTYQVAIVKKENLWVFDESNKGLNARQIMLKHKQSHCDGSDIEVPSAQEIENVNWSEGIKNINASERDPCFCARPLNCFCLLF